MSKLSQASDVPQSSERPCALLSSELPLHGVLIFIFWWYHSSPTSHLTLANASLALGMPAASTAASDSEGGVAKGNWHTAGIWYTRASGTTL